jgi:UDP-glucose 4-epimerase
VADLCRAHLLASDRLLAGEVKGAEVYNLANGVGFTVLEVIEACRKVTGQPIEYRQMPRRAGDPASLVGEARRAADVLGWKPELAGLEGIIRTSWEWMKNRVGLTA